MLNQGQGLPPHLTADSCGHLLHYVQLVVFTVLGIKFKVLSIQTSALPTELYPGPEAEAAAAPQGCSGIAFTELLSSSFSFCRIRMSPEVCSQAELKR